ncbi:MAG TPA: tetratricopeptide repeat protein [Micropepsaceae bacterium]|nr:tetratricopeptide repeat protein [Micropepsaceae bacterium]
MNNAKPPQSPPLRAHFHMPGADLKIKLQQAFGLHQQGRLGEAEQLYREILARAPDQPDALHFLGVLETQRGRHEVGLAHMERAIAINPRNPAAQYNRANALRDIGRTEDAIEGYDAALAIKPDNVGAWNNRGVALHALTRYEEAIASYDRALALKPDHLDAHANRGNTLMELSRYDEALTAFDRVVVLAPDDVSGLYGRANALAKLNRHEEALAFYDRALAIAPEDPRILNNRGNTLSQLSRYEEALADFGRAITAAPNSADAFANRGDALMQLRRHEEALENYRRALELNGLSFNALYGRGSALVELKRHGEALAAFDRLLRQKPDYPYAPGMLVYAQSTCCDWRDAVQTAEMIKGIRAGKRVATPLALLAVCDSEADKLRCSQIVMQDRYPAQKGLWRGEIYRHDRIRVAYLSADFRTHPVGILMAGVFEHHDRTRFETIAISHGLDDRSEMRSRLKRAFDRFIDVQGKSDREVASLLRALEVDIAVDLTGLTASGRPGIFARRPVPVQVNYLGFAGSTAAPHMDYILADRIVIPEEQRQYYTEKIAYLPDSYMPHDRMRRIAAHTPPRSELGLPETGFVFASFNNSYKFAAATFDVWMRLLHAVEGSVLWLPNANPTAVRNLQREADARGVSPDRIVFAPHVPAAEDHLARLRAADLFLDTLPYNAHSTAMDALWAGLPILTVKGESFASRVAASLLIAAGLPELIVDSLDAYESRAIDLARDPSTLAALTEKLRASRDSCALFDTARFTRNLEAALGMMWERTQRGELPASFSVEDPARAFP